MADNVSRTTAITRRLQSEDIPCCLAIVRENWGIATAQSCHVELGQAFGEAVWKPIFYVAETGGQVVGVGGYCVSWMNYGIYDITWINVLAAMQRRGIGRLIVNRCLDDIRAVGLLAMLSTDIPEYYERWWGFERCFAYGHDTVMRLPLGVADGRTNPMTRRGVELAI